MSAQEYRRRLLDSDIRYFQAAAKKLKIFGGELSYMPDLSSQAGACVFHSLQRLPETSELWLKQLENLFNAVAATQIVIQSLLKKARNP
jgi:hypothetical protein